MSRQRMVKPEFYDSESLGKCSIKARFLFIALWVHGNDYGNLKARLSWIKLKTFPYDDISDHDILDMLCELERVGCVRGYIVDGDAYINIPNFETYQTVRKPNKSNVPDPPEKMPKRTHLFTDLEQCGTSDAPVTYQCVNNNEDHVENYVETAPVRHQYGTSDAQKKEGKKEVVVLQQQLPKEEGAAVGAAVAGATPPSAPTCPLCGTELDKTGMHGGDEWFCDTCKDFFASEKVVA